MTENMKEAISLISKAESEIIRADSASSYENEKTVSLCAIAKSLTAIAIMIAEERCDQDG